MDRSKAKVLKGINIALFITVSFLVSSVAIIALTNRPASADSNEWIAGNIISDEVFTNNRSMTVDQIQTFLNAKNPSCDTNGTRSAADFGRADLTHAQYAAMKGWPGPPYTCLKDYSENGRSAAQIFYDASQEYSINPQVLLVLVQKEQSLVTDTWPLPIQYKWATGYRCPDHGSCNEAYSGLTRQVNGAAGDWHYAMTPNSGFRSGFILNANNKILFNPDGEAACGASTVYIQNRATWALYTYTPYQPNNAVLSANPGTTVTCGAYGNLNFFRYFTSWFGTSRGTPYASNNATVETYTNETQSQTTTHNSITTGQKVYIVMKFRNNGGTTWNNSGTGTMRLATEEAQSSFCDSSWVNCSRAANMQEPSVGPGGMATFKFWYKAPTVTNVSEFATKFKLIAEGVSDVIGGGSVLYTKVLPLTYTTNNTSITTYTNETMAQKVERATDTMSPNDRLYMVATFRNNGSAVWSNSGPAATRLAVMGNTPNAFKDTDSLNDYRLVTMQEPTVGPGGTATFKFWYKAPIVTNVSDFATKLGLVSEGVATMTGEQPTIYTRVRAWTYAVNNSTVNTHTDASLSQPATHNSLTSGTRVYITMTFRNNGSAIWSNTGAGSTRLAIIGTNPNYFKDTDSISDYRVVNMQEPTVGPGGTATFKFWYKAPTVNNTSAYATRFGLISETVATMAGDQPTLYTVVNP